MRAHIPIVTLVLLLTPAVVPGLTAATLNADTIYVCWDGSGDYLTIQEGIDAAQDGDEVVVCDGVYTGPGNKNLDFHGKAIIVRSANGPENCVIDSQGDGLGFYFHTGETNESVADGFTITNGGGSSWGAGITCTNSSNPTITNCIISRNILDNGSFMMGAGICCVNSDPIVRNCTISENTIYVRGPHCHGLGAGINCSSSNAVIVNCTITANIVDGTDAALPSNLLGGGICAADSNLTITDCTIGANAVIGAEPVWGGGICLLESDSPTITNCIITGNVAYSPLGGSGAGIAEYRCGSTIANCIIAGNTADDRGAGICGWKSSAAIANCTIAGNTAGRYGGGIHCTGSSPGATVASSVLWGNDAPQGAEISLVESPWYGPATLTVSYSDVRGGQEGAYVDGDCRLIWTVGNIDGDPLFVDPDGADDDPNTWEDNDFHLAVGSPCVDAGCNGGVPADIADLDNDGDRTEFTPLDLDREGRFFDEPGTPDTGCGCPPIVDMGAYESGDSGPQPCPGDLDCDRAVGHSDLGTLLGAWEWSDEGDLNCDGDTDHADLGILLAHWGEGCP